MVRRTIQTFLGQLRDSCVEGKRGLFPSADKKKHEAVVSPLRRLGAAFSSLSFVFYWACFCCHIHRCAKQRFSSLLISSTLAYVFIFPVVYGKNTRTFLKAFGNLKPFLHILFPFRLLPSVETVVFFF